MKKLSFLAIVLITFASCSKDLKYTINGTVNNASLNGKSIIMEEVRNGQMTTSDTINIVDNAFKFEGKTDSVVVKYLYIKDSQRIFPFQVVAEKGTINIDLNGTTATISGTPLNDKLQVQKNIDMKVQEQIRIVIDAYQAKANAGSNTAEDDVEFQTRMKAFADENIKNMISFAKENANNALGKYCFSQYYYMLSPEQQKEMMSFATDEIKAMFSQK